MDEEDSRSNAAESLIELAAPNILLDEKKVEEGTNGNKELSRSKFPVKLMQIIDNESFSHIISWTPDGSSFTIHKPLAFEKEVLCLTFDPTPQGGIKLQSFLRKLYHWGFLKQVHKLNNLTYFHKFFLRGNISLCSTITRLSMPLSKKIAPNDKKKNSKNDLTRNYKNQQEEDAAAVTAMQQLYKADTPADATVTPFVIPKTNNDIRQYRDLHVGRIAARATAAISASLSLGKRRKFMSRSSSLKNETTDHDTISLVAVECLLRNEFQKEKARREMSFLFSTTNNMIEANHIPLFSNESRKSIQYPYPNAINDSCVPSFSSVRTRLSLLTNTPNGILNGRLLGDERFTNVDNQFLVHCNLQRTNQRTQHCQVIDAAAKDIIKRQALFEIKMSKADRSRRNMNM